MSGLKYEFGKGIMIPLVKQDSKGSSSKIEDYRGITILPVIFLSV